MTAIFKPWKLSLTTQILIATLGGIIFGALVGDWAGHIKFIGDIFLRLIQMSVVALVMTSIASAVGGDNQQDVGKMGLHTFKWILTFTIFAALLGMGLSILIQPGVGINVLGGAAVDKVEVGQTSIQETLLNFVPTNIFEAMAEGQMVPAIVFSLFFGLAMGRYAKETGQHAVIDVIKQANGIITEIIKMVMNFAPIGIFCLLADVAGTVGFAVIGPMLKFLGLLFIGNIIQFALYIPLTAALTHVNPLKMPKKFLKMSIMALTTTSGAVCLPTKMEDMVEKFGISRPVTDFTGPITMTMNSTGAVQCYVAAIFFMAQATGIELSIYQMGMAILLSTLMCLGTISVPGGSLIVYTFLAQSLGLPLESLAILIGIDWFAGMFRTLMNVDVDVLIGMLVASKVGELDRDVYNEEKQVKYLN